MYACMCDYDALFVKNISQELMLIGFENIGVLQVFGLLKLTSQVSGLYHFIIVDCIISGTLADDVNSTKSPLDGKRKRQDDEINPQSEGDEPTTKKTKAEDENRSGDAESHHSKEKEDDDVQNPEGKTDSPLLSGPYEATSGEINAQEEQHKSGDGGSSFAGDDSPGDTDLTPPPPLLSPEAPCVKELPKLGKQSKDVPMPHLDFVGPDDTDEKSTDKASRSPPDLPKLDLIGDS